MNRVPTWARVFVPRRWGFVSGTCVFIVSGAKVGFCFRVVGWDFLFRVIRWRFFVPGSKVGFLFRVVEGGIFVRGG